MLTFYILPNPFSSEEPIGEFNGSAIVKKRYQSPLAESLIGWSLFTVLALKESQLSICTFLCGALLSEHLIIYRNHRIPGTRVSDSPAGAWLISLVPIILSFHDKTIALNLISASLGAFVLLSFLYTSGTSTAIHLSLWFICARVTYLTPTFNILLTFLFVLLLSIELLSSYVGSLTIWEAILLAQICFAFHTNTVFFIIPLLCVYTIGRFKMAPSSMTFGTLSISAMWLWSLLSDVVDHLVDEESYFDPMSVLHFEPLQFITDLITPLNILLVTTVWAPLCVVAVLVVAYFSQGVNGSNKTPFALRKLFHLLAGVVYATGLLVSPTLLSVAAVCVLLAFFLIEWTRRSGPPVASKFLNDVLGPFRDLRDSGELIFTPIALLLGLSLPVWNFCYSWPQDDPIPPQAWSGVITIALGDSVAALVGRQWGHLWFCWPGTHRTLIGSGASFVSQMLLWVGLAAFYGWPWRSGVLPLAFGVLAEAYTEQIDNLAIPLLVMSLWPSS
ncbi:Dolichol kinase [Echinococcus granulosus]|uniref:dolichol kinase n=2 Tax=Echinococcus granulosus TaxID=6210 RepID=W6UHB5_ECHGR|nr:Dolichol kinase [Echinococcus granulosus]EUB60448.1 Dolichol kinase [Echinococcus granulosus]